MPDTPPSRPRRIRLRYPANCVVCSISLSPGTEAVHDPSTKTVTSVTCMACAPTADAVQPGIAGASARDIAENRVQKRVDEVQRRYGDHAAEVARQMANRDPSIASWSKGGNGERRLAAWVARELGDAVIALHDRLIPGLRTNIDHVFVAPSGVWVVDAKAYQGKVVRRDVGPFWREDNRLYIAGRNRTSLVDGLPVQVDAVVAALGPDPDARGTDVSGALCLVESEWGLTDRPFRVGNVWVLYPGALRKRLRAKGPLTRERMERLARRLDLSLPAAPPSRA